MMRNRGKCQSPHTQVEEFHEASKLSISYFLPIGFRLNDDFGCYSLPLEFLEQSFFRAFFTHKFHNIHGFVLFSFIFWSRIKFVFLRIIAIVITHRLLDYGSCPSNFILVLSFIVLFRMSSHLNTVHNIKEIICTAFCSDDQIIVQVIASMFRIHFSFSSLFSLSPSLFTPPIFFGSTPNSSSRDQVLL